MKFKTAIIKLFTKIINFLSYFKFPLPGILINKFLLFVWEHPWMLQPLIATIRPEELERMAKKLVVYRFKKVSGSTPALREFYKENKLPPIRNFKDFKKLSQTNKENYVKKYPIEYRCVNGRLPSQGTLYKSAGTSGKPTIWAQSLDEEIFFQRYVNFGINYVFQAHLKNYKIINCWAFGTWPTAIDFTKAATNFGQLLNVGTNLGEALELLKLLGKDYQYLIAGYPPFLINLFEEGEKMGFIWKEWSINILSGGEGFIEEWREQIQDYLGPDAVITSAYGSTDLGLSEGMETPLSIMVRKIAHIYQTFLEDREKAGNLARKIFPTIYEKIIPKNEDTVRKLFMRLFKNDPSVDRRLPMIFQYDPTTYFNEEIVTKYEDREVVEMITTVLRHNTAIPRVRYNIQDERGIIQYREMFKIFKEFNIQLEEVVRSRGFNPKDMLHLPFFYIYGRSDGTVSIDGANIFPADVEELIADNREFDELICGFIMKVTEDHRLGLDFELKKDVAPPANVEELRKRFRKLLTKYSNSFKDIVREDLRSSHLVINFYPFSTGPFEISPLTSSRLIKYKYIRR